MEQTPDPVRALVDRLGRPSLEVLGKEIARYERRDIFARLALFVLAVVLVTAAIVVLLNGLWLGVLQIDGTSMAPRLQLGDVVLTVKYSKPARGDVIAFYYNNKIFVKRVIGTAGDFIDISGEGAVSVNSQRIDEPYVTEPSLGDCDIRMPYMVPSGTVFVMGDNRALSKDSRNQLGPIDKDLMIGKAVLRLWPLSRMGRVT